MISANDNLYEVNDSRLFLQNNQSCAVGNFSKEIGCERVKNVFFNIEKATLNDKVINTALISV